MWTSLAVGVLGSALRVDDWDHQDENPGEGKHYHDTQDNQPKEEEHVHLSWPFWSQRTADEKCCRRRVGIDGSGQDRIEQDVVDYTKTDKHMALSTEAADSRMGLETRHTGELEYVRDKLGRHGGMRIRTA